MKSYFIFSDESGQYGKIEVIILTSPIPFLYKINGFSRIRWIVYFQKTWLIKLKKNIDFKNSGNKMGAFR